jgi:hypothetical protein
MQEPMATEEGVGVATTILHSSGARIEFVPLVIALADRKPHTVGSAVTYAKRYALAAIFGLEGGVDDDGQEAQDSFQAKPKAAPVPSNGHSHHDDEQLWEPTAGGKSPDAATPAQIKRAESLGIKMYGTESWKEQAPKLAQAASKGSVSAIADLKVSEITVIIAGLEKRIAERAAQLQAASN